MTTLLTPTPAAQTGAIPAGVPSPMVPGWQAPPPVDDPAGGIRGALLRVHRVVGLTIAGWTALLAALLSLAGWALTRWVELGLAAVMIGVLVLIALLFTLGRPRYGVELRLKDERVVVGQEAQGFLAVQNRAARRSLPSRLDLPIGPEAASFAIPSLAGQAWQQEQFTIPTRRRGVIPIGPARSVQGDPFGLSGRTTDWTQSIELFVHPRTVNLPGRQAGFIHDLEGHSSTRITASDMSFHALREYVPGDDRRHVHWRSSARTGQLMVRQFEETLQSRVALALDTSESSYLDAEEFELAVGIVGSVALQCVREENPLRMMTVDRDLPSVSAMRSLDELSRVDLGHGVGFHELVTAVMHREPAASIVILATGATAGADRVRRAAASFEVDTRVVAVIADPSSPAGARTISNVSVLHVPELGELARTFRQAM